MNGRIAKFSSLRKDRDTRKKKKQDGEHGMSSHDKESTEVK